MKEHVQVYYLWFKNPPPPFLQNPPQKQNMLFAFKTTTTNCICECNFPLFGGWGWWEVVGGGVRFRIRYMYVPTVHHWTLTFHISTGYAGAETLYGPE